MSLLDVMADRACIVLSIAGVIWVVTSLVL